jgi:hypothetical protein
MQIDSMQSRPTVSGARPATQVTRPELAPCDRFVAADPAGEHRLLPRTPAAASTSPATTSAQPSFAGAPIPAPTSVGQPPQVGTPRQAPTLTEGTLHSPKFLGTEAEYFKEARRLIESSKPGDMVCLQMYQFQNAATDGETGGAPNAPGYPDQQALLTGLEDAANRGVRVDLVLDASSLSNGGTNNDPVVAHLIKSAGASGNLTIDRYPANTVNIDHAKELLYLTGNGDGSYAVQEALVGGSNWSNHTPANDDGGGTFYGRDAVGAAEIFFRDQAFSRGDTSDTPLPIQTTSKSPVTWGVTAPSQEGGGSDSIKAAKLDLTKQADEIYFNDYCLTNKELLNLVLAKGAKAHVRLCPTEHQVNSAALAAIRHAKGQALWANTKLDPEHMPAQKNHEKLDVYVQKGVPIALTFGSANDTGNGLDRASTVIVNNQPLVRLSNHEIDAVVRRVSTGESTPEGTYSTEAFLDAALHKTVTDLKDRSSRDLPEVAATTMSNANPEVPCR